MCHAVGVQELRQRDGATPLFAEVVAFRVRVRVAVPSFAVIVSPIDAGLTKDKCIAQQIFVKVGVNLDEAVAGDV